MTQKYIELLVYLKMHKHFLLNIGEYSSVVEGLEAEFPNLNCEYLNLDSLCNWQPCDMDDIDTDTLVR